MKQILIAGFGGQGVLFTGRIIAHAGMMAGMEVSWLPSYGPEMRGGTANCGVCLSEKPIGCPLVTEPDTLIAMNTPSYNKFIGAMRTGGQAFLDASLVNESYADARGDIAIHRVAATRLAQEENLPGMAGIILLGKMLAETGLILADTVGKAMEACLSESKAHLLDANLRALRLGESA